MARKEKTTGRVRAHTRYKTRDGKIVPGVTTIIGVLNKPALVRWANQLGLQGIDSTKFVDEKASIGTLAHEMVMQHFAGTLDDMDFSDYTQNQIDLAENSLISFFEWESKHTVEPILVEHDMVSESMLYGGCCDLYCRLDGEPVLVDIKTGKAIYKEMGIQLAAYKNLLEEAGYKVSSSYILRIGRDEDEGFDFKQFKNLNEHFEIFRNCLSIYGLMKRI